MVGKCTVKIKMLMIFVFVSVTICIIFVFIFIMTNSKMCKYEKNATGKSAVG